ncbi:MAG: hypothetical protein ACKVHP_04715, partial [Verrucomicrobiales bacterium]
FNTLTSYFSSGAFGAIVVTIFAVAILASGLGKAIGANFPDPTNPAADLYQRMIWGGIWGLQLFIPFIRKRACWKTAGLMLVPLPLAAHLFYFFPKMGAGMAGVNLGGGAWVVVAILTVVWGISAAYFARKSGK